MAEQQSELHDSLSDSHWTAIFGRRTARAFPIERRVLLLAGLATLAASGLRFETLSLELQQKTLVVRLGGRSYPVPLGQYGRAARYDIARLGGSWLFHARHLSAAPLSSKSGFDLRFEASGGEWQVSGAGDWLGRAGPVKVGDWLDGLAPLLFGAELPPNAQRYVRLSAAKLQMALYADGAWLGLSRNPVAIEIDGMQFQATSVRWTPSRIAGGGWVLYFEKALSVSGTAVSTRLQDERDMRIEFGVINRLAVEVTRGGRGVLYFEGGASWQIDTSGRGMSFDIPEMRLVRVLSRRDRSTRILANLTGALGVLDLKEAAFELRGCSGKFCEVALRGGRAVHFTIELDLIRASVLVSDSDVVEWAFPAAPLILNVGRPSLRSPERLYLVDSGPEDDPILGDPLPGGDPTTPDPPESHITLDGAAEIYSVDVDRSLLRVLRARDLMDLKFGFSGLYLANTDVSGLLPELRVRGKADVLPALVVHFSAQHTYERAEDAKVEDGEVKWSDGDGPEEVVEARASGPSRLVFDLAEDARIPLTVKDLTAWTDLSLRVTGRAFKPESDVLEQLDYVGIRPGVMRPHAMELLRSSIERDRDLENPDPAGDQYLETALEMRYRMIVSPPAMGSHPEAVASHPDELDQRGAQLFSARLRAARTPPAELDGVKGISTDNDSAAASARPAIAPDEPRDLRVIWARGVDLGFLSGLSVQDEDMAPWDSTLSPREFPAAHSMQNLRELMMNTSIPALNALLGLREVENQDVDEEDNNDPETALDTEYVASPGQVVPQPEGFTFVNNGVLIDGKPPPDAGVAVATALGPSRVVMTSQGGSFASVSGFAPFAPYYLDRINGIPKPAHDWHEATTLEMFDARSILRRDIRVTVASKGFMYPFGHRASVIKLSERMYLPHASRKPGAKEQDPTSYLVRRYFLLIGRPNKTFPALGQPFDGRAGLALSSIRILTTRSPDLMNPITSIAGTVALHGRIKTEAGLVFWPRIEANNVEDMHGTDVYFEYQRDDEDAVLSAPLIYADNAAVHHAPTMKALAEIYRNQENAQDRVQPEQRRIVAPGRALMYARAKRRDETAFETDTIVMSVSGRAQAEEKDSANISAVEQVDPPGTPKAENFTMDGIMEGADQPPFYPIMETATARVQSVNRFLGRPNGTVELGMNPLYVAKGFETVANPSEIFLNIKTKDLYLDLASNGSASGGIAKPNMRIAMLSRSIGPVGGPPASLPLPSDSKVNALAPYTPSRNSTSLVTTAAESGRFDPVEMLGGALNDAKILGLISLKDVLKVVSMATGAPKLLESTAYEFAEMAGGSIDLGKVEEIAKSAVTKLDGALAIFLEGVGEALKKISDGDLTLADFYPGLDRTLRAVELAGKALIGQINESKNAVGADPTKLGKEYAKVTTKIGELLSAVGAVGDATDAVIDNPVPVIVSKTIDTITAEWKRLRATLTGDLFRQLEADLKAYINKGLLDDLRAKLPKPDVDENWEHFYAVFFGFPRPGPIPNRVEAVIAPDNEQLLKDVRKAYDTFLASKLNDPYDRVAALLKHHGESLLTRHFGLPLSRGIEALVEFEKAVKDDSAMAREALVGKLTDLIVKATQAILELGYLQQVSAALQQFDDFCKAATKTLTNANEGLAANFDLAEAEIQSLKQKMVKVRIPNELSDLDAARARVLIAANELLALIGEARAIKAELAAKLPTDTCASIAELDQITQLFRLQARALDRVRDLASALTDVQGRLEAAIRGRAGGPEALGKSELDDMNAALVSALCAVQGAIKALLGASGFKVADFKALVPQVKGYTEDVSDALDAFEAAFDTLNGRIGKIDPNNPKLAVKEVNALTQEAIDVIAQHSKPLAGWLTMTGDALQDIVEPWADWAKVKVLGVLGIANKVNGTGIDALASVEKLIDENEALKILIRAEVTQALSQSLDDLRAEQNKIEVLRDNFDIFDARIFIDKHWVKRPPAILGAVAVMQKLVEHLANGRLSALIDLRGLRDRLKEAALAMLPTRVNLSYDWSTEIGDYPASKPIFAITPEVWDKPKYWEVDGPISGNALREKFYPDGDANAADQKHLILEAAASINLLTGERDARAEGYLHPFTIEILPGFADIATLKFTAATFGAGTGRSSKFRATPADVEIGSALSYISALSSFLSGGGDQGPYYEISLLPPGIEVGYRLSLGQVVLGALIFYNISLNLSADLPLDDRDARFRFTFARRDLPFIISVPPYGGGGFVGFTANAKGITGFEASIEFGAMVGLAFGPIKGYGQITAGIYIAKTADGTTIIRGFVRAIGEGSIAIFTLTVYIEISLEDRDGQMTGTTLMSFTFKMKFIEFNYSFTAQYNTGDREREKALHDYSRAGGNYATGTVHVEQPSEVASWSNYRRLYGGGLLNRGWGT